MEPRTLINDPQYHPTQFPVNRRVSHNALRKKQLTESNKEERESLSLEKVKHFGNDTDDNNNIRNKINPLAHFFPAC